VDRVGVDSEKGWAIDDGLSVAYAARREFNFNSLPNRGVD